MNIRTNLIIACYFGKRRRKYPPYEENREFYLRNQIKMLGFLEHSLAQITFIVNGPERPEVPEAIRGTKVCLHNRRNIGISYGAYSYGFGLYMDQFNYYIFLEDDFVFVIDDFDKIMVNMFKQRHNCGYLASSVHIPDGSTLPPHASISNGISSNKVLKEVYKKFGRLPHHKHYSGVHNYDANEADGQVAQTNYIKNIGYELYDTRHRFAAPFMEVCGRPLVHHEQKSEYLCMPVELIQPYIKDIK